MISSIAVPRLVLAKQAAGAASAIWHAADDGQRGMTFAGTCGNGFYAPDLTSLTPPGSNEPFIGGGMGEANIVQRSSYTFRLEAAPYAGAPPTCNGLGAGQAGQGYAAAADPTEPTNPRFFGTNANAQLEHAATLWTDMPEVVAPPIGVVLR